MTGFLRCLFYWVFPFTKTFRTFHFRVEEETNLVFCLFHLQFKLHLAIKCYKEKCFSLNNIVDGQWDNIVTIIISYRMYTARHISPDCWLIDCWWMSYAPLADPRYSLENVLAPTLICFPCDMKCPLLFQKANLLSYIGDNSYSTDLLLVDSILKLDNMTTNKVVHTSEAKENGKTWTLLYVESWNSQSKPNETAKIENKSNQTNVLSNLEDFHRGATITNSLWAEFLLICMG